MRWPAQFLNGSGVLDFGDVHGIDVERTLRLRNDGGSTLDVGTALTVGSELFSIETPENFSLSPLEEAVGGRLTGAAGGTLEGLLAVNSNPSATIFSPIARPAGSDVTDLLNPGDIAEGFQMFTLISTTLALGAVVKPRL